ncbi:hypothetical protein [Silvibacterium acidisoli]|uniref:hypothetical protein n=1 Tax=Acidobacteriaceae bacterium ZG23-2 TaxID=2883246 RepID=UPI00406CC1A3
MSKKFADLTEEQKQKFNTQLASFGISPKDVPATIVADGKVHMHHDPELATVKTFTCQVKDLAQLKRLCGVPDKVFQQPGSDAHIPYPAKFAADRVRLLAGGKKEVAAAALTESERKLVDSSMVSYMLGNSSRVAPENVQAVNALNFPMTISVAAAQDLVVSGPYQVTQSLVCGTITIEPSGYLEIIGDASIQTQVFTVEGR